MNTPSLINVESVADEIKNLIGNEPFGYKKFKIGTLEAREKSVQKNLQTHNNFRQQFSEVLSFGHSCQNDKKRALQDSAIEKINRSIKFKLAPAQVDCCNLVLILVSRYFNIPIKQLMCKTRANAKAARARQIAIYFVHTMFSVAYKEAATYFQRDRTTIAHACKMIEDKRDDQYFDEKLSMVERLLEKEAKCVNLHGLHFTKNYAAQKSAGEYSV